MNQAHGNEPSAICFHLGLARTLKGSPTWHWHPIHRSRQGVDMGRTPLGVNRPISNAKYHIFGSLVYFINQNRAPYTR